MEVALSTDSLSSRDLPLEILETAYQVFDKSPLWALHHLPENFLSPLENKQVFSSFLSRRFSTRESFFKNDFLIPGASQSIFIPCKYKGVFNVGVGLSHGIKRCQESRQITYFLDLYPLQKGEILRQKIFRSYLKNYFLKNLKQCDEIWIPHSNFYPEIFSSLENVRVVFPPMDLSEFKILPEGIFKQEKIGIVARGLRQSEVLSLIRSKISNKIFFLGDDSHLEKIKKEFPHFFKGGNCAGELLPLFSSSQYVVDFTQDFFPRYAVAAKACGRAVVSSGYERKSPFLGRYGVSYVENFEALLKILHSENRWFEMIDSKKVAESVKKFHPSSFKKKIQKAFLN